jgi:hypothetical protein
MPSQQCTVICSGSGTSFQAKVSVVTFGDEKITSYGANLQRSDLERFCELAGLPIDTIGADRDGSTGYDHEKIISAATLAKFGFKELKPVAET